ncbi:hypothetical protein GCM10023093_10480 [Nemorincola caseinilytica]|uniref:Uncharacterized protein n=1 Tax=Nemorincola caseinilytica TaxID=2054315 RepID=A0ABP8N8E6_9BACT
MKVEVIPSVTYDDRYPRQYFAATVAVLLMVIWTFINHSVFITADSTPNLIWAQLVVRIISSVWVYNTMQNLNRDAGWSAFAAFCFPIIVLFISGVVKKKFIRFKIDNSYDAQTQLAELRAYAQGYISKGKLDEAAFIYQYMVDNLPVTQDDIEKYETFKGHHNIHIPEYKTVVS